VKRSLDRIEIIVDTYAKEVKKDKLV